MTNAFQAASRARHTASHSACQRCAATFERAAATATSPAYRCSSAACAATRTRCRRAASVRAFAARYRWRSAG
ncbi:MAG: hypothetical protein AUI10_05885 [Actinobacteria bacterium 13_2_20CM_2_72_6]|nr:MAG: hypothetical protein AUI10_05885 [Actinobacteria bacterium 13_2_20CM_2_72_6]